MQNLHSLINHCQNQLTDIKFIDSGNFYWSPKTKAIHYNGLALDTQAGQWALIHEMAHASLKHESYANDLGLLSLEVEAWQAAEKLSREAGISIDVDHIQECLNTYRDWLYARSTCPTCELNSLQIAETTYLCLNCSTRWNVSGSRFCRPYRMTKGQENGIRNKQYGEKLNNGTVFA